LAPDYTTNVNWAGLGTDRLKRLEPDVLHRRAKDDHVSLTNRNLLPFRVALELLAESRRPNIELGRTRPETQFQISGDERRQLFNNVKFDLRNTPSDNS